MTNETEIDTIVIDKVMKFWDLLFCDCCYIGICLLYSPRVWRWSFSSLTASFKAPVFSTCVEVILLEIKPQGTFTSILHVCGGDPTLWWTFSTKVSYSPRVWRWSPRSSALKTSNMVFSTCVEVILTLKVNFELLSGILHVCGGDPYNIRSLIKLRWYSPRVWRWSYGWNHQKRSLEVFSTCVEVIPL